MVQLHAISTRTILVISIIKRQNTRNGTTSRAYGYTNDFQTVSPIVVSEEDRERDPTLAPAHPFDCVLL